MTGADMVDRDRTAEWKPARGPDSASEAADRGARRSLDDVAARFSLSARLLLLTVLFVMLAELLIYAPSIARYRKTHFEEVLATGRLAAMALEAAPQQGLSPAFEQDLLNRAGAYGVVLRTPGQKMLALSRHMPDAVDSTIDVDETAFAGWISGAFGTLLLHGDRVLRVIGDAPGEDGVSIEVILDEGPLRTAMIGYSQRILGLSVVISLFTAALIYISLQWLLVRPTRRLSRAIVAFRRDPENPRKTIRPSRRTDEIGRLERELLEMQNEIRQALRQKSRMAALGAAVTKINHDLRNSLSTAMLVSDRLARIEDPEVRRVTPKLYGAIYKAVNLCSQTLEYAREGPPRLVRRRYALIDVLEEAKAMNEPLGPGLVDADAPSETGEWEIDVPGDLEIEFDRDQLVRALTNLARNAFQAGAGRVRIAVEEGRRFVGLVVSDDGPGLPSKARENLFKPFAGSGRKGGTGLGLVIAREIARAHGGDLELVDSGEAGTTFRFDLPRQVPPGEPDRFEPDRLRA